MNLRRNALSSRRRSWDEGAQAWRKNHFTAKWPGALLRAMGGSQTHTHAGAHGQDHGHEHADPGGHAHDHGHDHAHETGHSHEAGHAAHHDHSHSGPHNHTPFEDLRLAFLLNVSFTILEVVGGLWTNSTAILADALHDLGDSLSLAFALVMERVSGRRRDARFSYGYRRFSLLSAMVSALVLIGGSVWVLTEALPRFWNPQPTHALGMMGLAVVGILFNGMGALRLRRSSGFNARMVAWHLLEDVLGWVAVLIGSLCIYFFQWAWMDPALAIAFTLFTSWNVIRLGRKTLTILLQGVPHSVDAATLEDGMRKLEGIQSVHDTHVWSLDGDYHVMTTHVVLADSTPDQAIMKIKQEVRGLVTSHSISHATIEVERADEACHLRDC